MITVEYINRYGDHILFTEREDGTILMTGGSYWRCGWNSEDVTTMVDPSGGPYVGLGYDMGLFHDDWFGRLVKKIEMKEEGAVFSF